MQQKKEAIKKEIARYCDAVDLNGEKQAIFALLDTLESRTPTAVSSAQKPELFAAAMIRLYHDRHRFPLVTKELAAFFGLNPSTLSSKAGSLESKLKTPEERRKELRLLGFDTAPEIREFKTGTFDFVDRERTIMGDYYDLLDILDDMPLKKQLDALQKLIKRDPDFLDPYLLIAEIHEFEGSDHGRRRFLEKAYGRAVALIQENGLFPEELLWGFLDNRHIIRTLFNYAVLLWEEGQTDDALKIYTYLLKSNPNDNIGARYSVLGILQGKRSQEAMQAPFATPEGYLDAIKMEKWFQKGAKKYPEYFKE